MSRDGQHGQFHSLRSLRATETAEPILMRRFLQVFTFRLLTERFTQGTLHHSTRHALQDTLYYFDALAWHAGDEQHVHRQRANGAQRVLHFDAQQCGWFARGPAVLSGHALLTYFKLIFYF